MLLVELDAISQKNDYHFIQIENLLVCEVVLVVLDELVEIVDANKREIPDIMSIRLCISYSKCLLCW